MKERPKREGIMLAYPLDEGKLSRLGREFIVQPKYNGERCIVEWFADEPVLISSYGNERKFLDHITDSLKMIARTFGPIPFDGEIYVHGWSREQIDSALRRTVNKSSVVAGLEYHVFDIRTSETCIQRVSFLKALEKAGYTQDTSPIKLVPSFLANADNWSTAASKFITDGYEGAILRRMDAPWEAKRTVNMLKFKPTETDEYDILDINEAIDKHGHPKGMVGSFTVKAPDVDESFKVSAGKMNHARRVEIWRHRQLFLGKKLIVKHEFLQTSGGVPICAVAIDISPGK
jgi:ATP-dependent DNA ligase